MTAEWTNEFTLRFLEAYQAEPILWDPKDKFHKHSIVCCPNEDVEIHVGKPQLPIWGPISEVTTRASDKACEKNYDDYNIRVRFGPLIYRGVRADEGQFPHMAALGFENSYEEIEWRCGASLISLRYLVTAAHCFICNGCSDPKIARLGVIDINENNLAQDISVDRVIVHPGYNMTTKHNDIALIKLKTDVKPTEWVYPACLYSKANDPVPLQIVGWGITAPGDRNSISQNLQYGFIVPIDIEQCNKTVRKADESSSKTILKTQICGTTTTDACQGDSGGPLQTSTPEGGYEVVGIISYGSQCGSKLPGVYTRVSEYLDWIESIVWPNYLS